MRTTRTRPVGAAASDWASGRRFWRNLLWHVSMSLRATMFMIIHWPSRDADASNDPRREVAEPRPSPPVGHSRRPLRRRPDRILFGASRDIQLSSTGEVPWSVALPRRQSPYFLDFRLQVPNLARHLVFVRSVSLQGQIDLVGLRPAPRRLHARRPARLYAWTDGIILIERCRHARPRRLAGVLGRLSPREPFLGQGPPFSQLIGRASWALGRTDSRSAEQG